MTSQASGRVIRIDAALEALVSSDAEVEKLAGGFGFTEGPIWTRQGTLVFSDIPRNTMYQWTPNGEVSVYRQPSGFDGDGAPPGALIGSNGLTLDAEGRIVVCEHGNRRVTRLEHDGAVTVLADRWGGKRLNSPNDAVHKSDGSLYFTDPPYGLLQQDRDPAKELDFNGLFRLVDGKLQLLHAALTRPNGLAFTPDEKYLYVANSDRERRIWMRFEVNDDGSLGEGEVFLDVTAFPAPGAPDGMKLDRAGNLFCTGPGGILVITPDAHHLGTIQLPEQPANLHWGDLDARTLYITARTGLYRVRTNTTGIRP